MGKKIDSHCGAGLVALMVKLGALQEPCPSGFAWQRPHKVTERASQVAAELAFILGSSGTLSWDRAEGMEIQQKVTELNSSSDSWIDAGLFSKMINENSNSSSQIQDNDDPLEQLFAMQREARQSSQREATLRWLLDDEVSDDD
jgi:hypothetical protein